MTKKERKAVSTQVNTTRELPEIEYISVIPGAGKTRWAARYILDNAVSKKSILLYVAPTNTLLNQVLNVEIARLNDNDDNRVQYADVGNEKLPWFRVISADSAPDHVNICKTLTTVLNGGSTQGYRSAKPGDCLFITHQAFLNLAGLRSRKRIEVIFDEAGSFTIQSRKIKLDPVSLRVFHEYVDFTVCSDGKGQKTEYRRLRLRKEADWDHIPHIQLDKDFVALLERLKSRRYDVYTINNRGDDHLFFDVVSPTRIFRGFKRAVVMSAFFESSEMYHILAKRNRMVCINEELDMDRMRRILKNRYSKVVLHPVAVARKSAVTGESLPILTKTLLHGNLLVTDKQYKMLLAFRARWRSHLGQRNTAVTLIKLLRQGLSYLDSRSEFSMALRELKNKLRGAFGNPTMDPLEIFLDISTGILDEHDAISTANGGAALLVINKGLTRKQQHLAEQFEVISPRSHGMNQWSDRTALVFLGAFNPTPTMAKFFKFYIPKYNPTFEWVGNTALQNMNRTCIRDPNNINVVHAVLPDELIAKYVADQLGGVPKVMKPRISIGMYLNEKTDFKLFGSYTSDSDVRVQTRPLRCSNGGGSHYESTVNLRLNALARHLKRKITPRKKQQLEAEQQHLKEMKAKGLRHVDPDYKYRHHIRESTFVKYLAKAADPTCCLRRNSAN